MNKIFVFIFVFALFLLMGCATDNNPRAKDPNFHRYAADLDGDGAMEIIDTDDKTATESITLVEIKKKDKKDIEVIDNFSIPGKIRKIDFVELNLSQPDRIVVYFDDKNGISNIIIYQLRDNKASKVFFASSEYGIETNFDSIARIKVGKDMRSKSPNLMPDWDTWIWCGDKFVKE